MSKMVDQRFNPKIALLGSGMIGGTAALLAGLYQLSNNVVLLDVVQGMPSGKALDLGQALAVQDITISSSGCSDISPSSPGLEDSDVVVVTAGFPRKPGMSREDLLAKNGEVIANVGAAIKSKCPNAFVVVITNPLDVMVAVLQKASGLPPNRVVGMAGLLDSARFRFFLAEELRVSVHDVHTLVLGSHGDDMVPLKSSTSISGISLKNWIQMGKISQERVDEIIARTRKGGGEIVELLQTGSAYVAPAFCAIQMVQAYLRNERRIIPCCACLNGEYGLKDMYIGVPAIIGTDGVEEIVQVTMDSQEKNAFDKCIQSINELRKMSQDLGIKC